MPIQTKPAVLAGYPAWAKNRLEEAPGWLASLLLHVAALLVFWQIVHPMAQRTRSLETIIVGNGPFDEPGFLDGLAADGNLPVENVENNEIARVWVAGEERLAGDEPADAGTPEDIDAPEQSGLPHTGRPDPLLPATMDSDKPHEAKTGTGAGGENRGKASRAAPRKSGSGNGAGKEKEQGAALAGILNGRGPEAREKLVKAGGGSKASERAVDAGLEWLARQQQPNGSWSFQQVPGDAGFLDCPTGATGLALLAFLGAGHTHRDGLYRSHVNEGLRFLTDQMEVSESGGWLRGTGQATMYVQGIGAIALCEAFSMTKDPALKRPAQLAIEFIVKAQDAEGGGWRYRIPQAGDTSVVGWQLMALQSAKIAELSFPPRVIVRVTRFLKSVEFDGGASYGYQNAGNVRPSMTAVGLLCRMYLGREQTHKGMTRGMRHIGEWGPSSHDMYYNYYATQAMHHWGGPGWERWNSVMRDLLVNSQDQAGDLAGSWGTDGGHGSQMGGRLYTTCLSILTLEVYYRYLSLYRRPGVVEAESADESHSTPPETPAGK
jgi:hypothetical protein